MFSFPLSQCLILGSVLSGSLAVFYVRRCSVCLSGSVLYKEVFSLAPWQCFMLGGVQFVSLAVSYV